MVARLSPADLAKALAHEQPACPDFLRQPLETAGRRRGLILITHGGNLLDLGADCPRRTDVAAHYVYLPSGPRFTCRPPNFTWRHTVVSVGWAARPDRQQAPQDG